jgi:hypothetical protein
MDQLKEAGISVYAIQGQHGHYKRMPWSSIHAVVDEMNKRRIIDYWPDGKPIYALGYDNMPGAELAKKLAKVPTAVEVLVVHQLAKDAVPRISGAVTWDYELEWVPAHVKLVIMGDYHAAWDKTVDGTTHIYTGSSHMCAIDEPTEKSFLRIEPTEARQFDCIRVPINPPRHFFRYRAETADQFDKVLVELGKMPEGAVGQITVEDSIPDVEARCQEANADVHLLPISRIIKSIIDAESYSVDQLRKTSMLGCLDEVVDREKEPEFHDFMTKTLTHDDSHEVGQEMERRFIQDPEPAKQSVPDTPFDV